MRINPIPTLVFLATFFTTVLIWQILPLFHYLIVEDFLIISRDFFVKCSSEHCDSILIPFLGYLLNLNTDYKTFLIFNTVLVCLAFGIHTFIMYQSKAPKDKFSLQAYVLLSIGFFISIDRLAPPDILGILIATTGIELYFMKSKFAPFFLFAPLLIFLTGWAVEYTLLIFILIFTAHSKIEKGFLITLFQLIIIGGLLTQIYLFLIDNQSNWFSFFNESKQEKIMAFDFWSVFFLIATIVALCLPWVLKKINSMNVIFAILINIIFLLSCMLAPYNSRMISILLITTTFYLILNAQYTQRKLSAS